MKKILSLLLAMSMLLTMLAACNGDTTSNGDENEDPIENQETEEVSDTLTLVKDGVSEYVIVRGENASPSEITAAKELQSYLKQISGAELKIVTDSTEKAKKEIIVGKTNREADGDFDRNELGKEGFVIKSTGSTLWLVGGEQRGTLYSVYSFLEEYLGVRYYHATVEKVPEMKTIQLDKIEENKQIPVFTARLSDWLPKSSDWSVKQKINDNTHVKLSEEVGGGVAFLGQNHSGEFVHSMQYYVNYYTYKDTHPEYFAVDENGNMRICESHPQWTQACLTNPDVLQLTIDGARKVLAEKPYVNYISISENDTRDTCKCENCARIDAEEGSHAGTMLRFVNAVAENIKADYPDVKVEALAYFETIDAPTITKPAENVLVRIAPIEQCIVHSTEECQEWWTSELTGKSTYQMIKEWSDLGCELFIWDYSNDFGESTKPWPSLYPLKEDCKMYADMNVTGIFYQGNSFSNSGEFGELRSYILAKLFWNPYMSDEEFEYHVNDFLQGFYGEGWQYIRAYLDDLLKSAEGTHLDTWPKLDGLANGEWFYSRLSYNTNVTFPEELTYESFLNPETVDWSPYYEYYASVRPEMKDFLKKAFEDFEKAEALAKDEAELGRIQKTKIQVYTLEIYYLDRLTKAVKSNLNQLRQNFFLEHPEYSSDQAKLTTNPMKQHTEKIINDLYYEKNSFLFDEMLRFGVGATPGNSNLYRSKDEANLHVVPEYWY